MCALGVVSLTTQSLLITQDCLTLQDPEILGQDLSPDWDSRSSRKVQVGGWIISFGSAA